MDLGYTHLLLLYDLETAEQSNSVFNYYTPLEVSWGQNILGYKPTWNERGHKSKLLVRLVMLSQPYTSYSVEVSSVVSPMLIRHEDGGETYINLSQAESARRVAFRKGLKRLRKECARY
jgi:hypothetical protein